MLADGGDNDACALFVGFFHKQTAHDEVVFVIKMADRFIQEDKVERLAKASYKSDTLLLPEGEFAGFFIDFVGNADCF